MQQCCTNKTNIAIATDRNVLRIITGGIEADHLAVSVRFLRI